MRLILETLRYHIMLIFTDTPITQTLRYLCFPRATMNCPGRRWGVKGHRMVALIVQMWYTGCSVIAMNIMVAMKFWKCSKQSHMDHRGGWLLKSHSNVTEGKQTHRRDCRIDAQWSANGHHVIIRSVPNLILHASAPLLPHMCLIWATKDVLWTTTDNVPPFGDHGNSWSIDRGDGSASFLRVVHE